MPKRKALQCVIIHRDGKRLKVMPNQTFDFSPEELADLKRMNPDALESPKEAVQEVEVKLPPANETKAEKKAREEAEAAGKDDL